MDNSNALDAPTTTVHDDRPFTQAERPALFAYPAQSGIVIEDAAHPSVSGRVRIAR